MKPDFKHTHPLLAIFRLSLLIIVIGTVGCTDKKSPAQNKHNTGLDLTKISPPAKSVEIRKTKTTGANIMNYPNIDNPNKEWCYLAKSTTLVGMPFMPDCVRITWDGALYTRYAELCFFYGKDFKPVLQRQKTWHDGWIPIVEYDWQEDGIHYATKIFNINLDGTGVSNTVSFVRVTMTNKSPDAQTATLLSAIRGSGKDYRDKTPHAIAINANYEVKNNALYRDNKLIYTFSNGADIEAVPGVAYTKAFNGIEHNVDTRAEVGLAKYNVTLNSGDCKVIEFKMPRVPVDDETFNAQVLTADLSTYYNKTIDYWTNLMGKVCVIDVPEKRIRDAMKASTMHAILGTRTRDAQRFQTDGLPYPNCFISALFDYQRAYDCLGLSEFVRTNIPQLTSRLQPDGMLLDTSLCHGKVIFSSHGQALMLIVNHIMFTRDKEFAKSVYPVIQKAVTCIQNDHKENKYGLMRPSWPYDNEMISGHYTCHNLWCIAALRKSICVARLIENKKDEQSWLKLHESYEKAILTAIDKSVADDGYVPTGLYEIITGEAARKGFAEYRTDQDWDNSLLAWPSEVLKPDDPRVTATTDRLRRTKYREGIMTYRNGQHLHQYNTVNPATQELLIGRTQKALIDIYHILLHCGSTYEGYENQVSPWTDRLVHGAQPPHAWGAAKVAGLIRNMFVMEHGGKLGLEPENHNLYLFAAVAPNWARPDEKISIKNAPTEFGLLDYAEMVFTTEGAKIRIKGSFHTAPAKYIVRIPYFVKNVSFTSNAKEATLKDNAVYLSNDATELEFKWSIDRDADKTTYQDILLAYRREPGWWNGSRAEMPKPPEGFLTEEEKAHPVKPLSFELVTKAYKHEYARRYNKRVAEGDKTLTIAAPQMLSDEEKKNLTKKHYDAMSLTVGKPVTASQNQHNASIVNNGNKGNTHKYWEAQPANGPAWWLVDFTKIEDVRRIVVVPYYNDKRYYQYTVETSVDGKNWVLLIDQSKNTTNATSEGYSFEFQATQMRYLRVNMLKNSNNPGLHLVEVMAYDK